MAKRRKPAYLSERWQGPGIPRLLLVDDDAAVRRTTVRFLTRAGFEVVSVGSSRAALTLVSLGEPFDVAVIDLDMPGMDGLTLVAEIHSRRPALPLGLWTASAKLEDLTPGELAPVAFVKHKMQPIGELVQAVCQAIYGARAAASGDADSAAPGGNGSGPGGGPNGGDERGHLPLALALSA